MQELRSHFFRGQKVLVIRLGKTAPFVDKSYLRYRQRFSFGTFAGHFFTFCLIHHHIDEFGLGSKTAAYSYEEIQAISLPNIPLFLQHFRKILAKAAQFRR